MRYPCFDPCDPCSFWLWRQWRAGQCCCQTTTPPSRCIPEPPCRPQVLCEPCCQPQPRCEPCCELVECAPREDCFWQCCAPEICLPVCRPCPPCPPPAPRCQPRVLQCCIELPRHRGVKEACIKLLKWERREEKVLVEYEAKVSFCTCRGDIQTVCQTQTACFEGICCCGFPLSVKPRGETVWSEGRCHVMLRQEIEICC